MSTRCAITRVCIFLMLACGYNGVTFAENPESKAKNVGEAAELAEEATKAEANAEAKKLTEPALAINYSSVFDDYVSFEDIPDIGWKEANDNVGQIGGWRAYANLVQEEAMKEKSMKEEAMKEEAMKEKAMEEAELESQEKESDK